MNNSTKAIIFVLIVVVLGAGIYFKDEAANFYKSLNNKVQEFKKIDIGQTAAQVEKQMMAPPPLNVGGKQKQSALLKSLIISETNRQRQENGNLSALKENAKLDEAASAKANDMFAKQYFEHISPLGIDPGKLVQSYGYDYIVSGENLILGNFSSEKEVVQDWMNSPGHRANILNNRFTEIGVSIIRGYYKGEYVWIGVQEFGLPLASCVQPTAAAKSQIDLENMQLDAISAQLNQEKQQISETNPRSSIYKQMVDDYNKLVSQYNSLAELTKKLVALYNEQVNNFNSCVAGK